MVHQLGVSSMYVIIDLNIYSNPPAEAGIWCIRIRRWLMAVPRPGDQIELADGWASRCVKDTTFMADGRVIVSLEPVKTGNPDVLREKHTLVDAHDWRWIGSCLLYTSDAADDLLCVDLGGRRIIKKKNTKTY